MSPMALCPTMALPKLSGEPLGGQLAAVVMELFGPYGLGLHHGVS